MLQPESSSTKTMLFAAAMLGLAACSQQTPGPYTQYQGMPPDGTVEMHEVQAAYIGNAGGGSGTLFYHGRTYPFRIAGLGVGGIGASTIDAKGDVYNLPNVTLFPGAYAQGSTGFVIGATSRGDLWLQNNSGVVMHLRAKREGLMLTLGGDAIVISMQ
ncbi:MAG: hypothetical protein JOY71_10400 [Acetobacteraceae bacterium]|nr:hypothetical protein [Acetobacteraceae bacterium]MBV8522513.1 hypothetical protein [Acetobacteraceae bacterium]